MCDNRMSIPLPDPDGSVALREIDTCMAPIILALNNGGVRTYGCCCGHGEERGYVKLADGRVMVIFNMSVEPDEADLNRALRAIS